MRTIGGHDMELEVFVTPGLGDNSYLLASGGEAALIDPQRDVERMLRAAAARGADVRLVLETHIHNDYVSGAAEVRAATGAEIAGPAEAGYAFAFTPLNEGRELHVGGIKLVAVETPGHTPEHTAYAAFAEGSEAPAAVFTGGSLIVGSAGRTDLLGPDLTDRLTRDQYRSLRHLLSFPDDTEVLPTHGAGSFCATVAPHQDRTSTIGRERASNPTLAEVDEDAFVREQLSGLLAYPRYYAHMAPINRAGPRVFGQVPLPRALVPDEAAALLGDGAWMIDGRGGADFAAAHVPGSLNVPLDDSFGSYVGWLVPFGDPVVLVPPEPEDESVAEAAAQLFRIGYERFEGYVAGGIGSWRGSGRDVRSYPVATVDDVVAAARSGADRVLDVRQRTEWEAGHLPGSTHVFVADLPGRVDELPRDREMLGACSSGHRAAIAASILDRAGVPVRLVARSGVPKALRMLG
ncbi:MAG TPA: MBL fold metallo-hydrolase [Actinomycetota bacterium]